MRTRQRTGNAERRKEPNEAEGPILPGEALLAGVEGQVGVGALGVVVGRGEANARGGEGAAGHDGLGGGTDGGAGGDHLLQRQEKK